MTAPLYMTIITVYFLLLPFFMAGSIYQAIQKKYERHLISQVAIFLVTVFVIIYFETMLRISGGFEYYVQYSDISYNFLVVFLVVHIAIAIASVIAWAYLIYTSLKAYKNGFNAKTHKKLGKIVFLGLSITCIMGTCIYYFLFIN